MGWIFRGLEKLVSESTFEVELIDGRWLPRNIVARGSDGRISRHIEIMHAEIDRPEHPRELTLADLQLEAGTLVVARPGAGQSGAWDGKHVITIAELNQRLANGRAPTSAARIRELRRLQYLAEIDRPEGDPAIESIPGLAGSAGTMLQKRYESEWERYVREFIVKYSLIEEQAQKCQAILRACQAVGNEHVKRHRDEFNKLDQDLAAHFPRSVPQRQSAVGCTEIADPVAAQLPARHVELMAPINDIFENRLKPRLQRIPTRAQRAQVGSAATSQPGASR